MKVNGSLVFDASSASEVRNLRIEKLASIPTYTAADTGRIIFLTTTNTLYYGSAAASAFVTLATGGNAYSQTDGDNLEASLGAGVNSSGVFVPGAFDGPIASATSFTNAINQLAAYADANNTLAELDDVTITSADNGDFLRYNGTKWVDHVLVTANVTDLTVSAAQINNAAATTASTAELNTLDGITATTAELNILDGATLTVTELNYVDGVTSSIQDQLDNKQALDAGLTALAVFNTNGYIVQTADNVYAGRTLVAPAVGISITNADGVAGNSTFALANGLASIEALGTTGFVVQSAADTFISRSIATASAGRITVTDGDGIAGSPTLDLATVTDAGTGTFLKITRDTYGRVSGTAAVVTADITGLVDAEYVNVGGDTMTGSLTLTGGSSQVVLPNAPTSPNHAANKAYVDAVAEGLHVHPSTKVIYNGVDAATYDNGTAGVGATLTLGSGITTIDGFTLTNGDRIMVIGRTNQFENGIYTRTSATVWTRALDMDTSPEMDGGDFVFNTEGTVYGNTGWVQTENVATVGTDPLVFQQFSGAGNYSAGTGLSLAGTVFNVNLGAGIAELGSDNVGIDLYTPSAGGIILTLDGSTRSTDNGSMLALLTGAGLTQDASGLYIAASAITNTMLVNSTITLDADDAGSDTVALGGTLKVFGDATSGVSTSIAAGGFKVVVGDATATQRGVAAFAAADFTITSGVVSISSISNGQLDNSSITVTGTTGSDAVSLGESFAIVGGSAPITTVSAANQVTISVADATTTAKGLAQFSSDFFSVTAGEVSLAASLDDLTNVSTADSAATGDVLSKTAGDWQPVSRATLVGSTSVGDHNDVTLTSPADGEVLTVNGSGQIVNQKIFHLETIGTAATTWTVTHSLGQQFCNVTVVDDSNEVVIPQSITFTSSSVVTVTFNTAVSGKLVVMGIA